MLKKKKSSVSGDLREGPAHKAHIEQSEEEGHSQGRRIQSDTHTAVTAGCGGTMVRVSRGRIHVIMLLLLFQAHD